MIRQFLTDGPECSYPAGIGDGFLLREAVMEDAPAIWEVIDRHRDYLRTWLPFVDQIKGVADEEQFLGGVLAVPYAERNIVFVIEQGDSLCGLCGFVGTDMADRRTEIGYWLLPEFQGRGVMTRCVRILCCRAVGERNINRVQIRCAAGNSRSNAIPLRLGFRLDGTEREGQLLVTGEYVDIHVYSLLKREVAEWPEF